MDYSFQTACVQPPPPLRKKKTEKPGVSVGEGGRLVHRLQMDDPFSSSSVKKFNNKIPVSSVFNDTERTVQNDCLP